MNNDEDEDLVFSIFFIAFSLLIAFFVVVGVGMIVWGLFA